MKNLKRITLLAMLLCYALSFAGDGNIFKTAEGHNSGFQTEYGQSDNNNDDGGNPGDGGISGNDPDPAPIDGYVWTLAMVGIGLIAWYQKKIMKQTNISR